MDGTQNDVTFAPILHQVSLMKVMIKCFLRDMLFVGSLQIPKMAMDILNPFVIGLLIGFFEDSSNVGKLYWHGYVFAIVLVLTKMISASFDTSTMFLISRLSFRVRAIVISTVYRKSLTAASDTRKESTMGEIVNLMAVDSNHLQNMIRNNSWLWLGPVYIIVGVYFVYTVIGAAAFASLAFIIFMLVVNALYLNKMNKYQSQLMKIKDERLKILSEVLNGIKVIKLYGWEEMFASKVTAIRDRELKVLLNLSIIDGIETFSWTVAMFWMIYIALVSFLSLDASHYLDAQTTFVTLNFIYIIRNGINMLPLVLRAMIRGYSSVKRVGNYLNAEDIDPDRLHRDVHDEFAIRISQGSFAWEKNGPLILENINLSIRPGQLVAVVGKVGAGKSSLISAVLGEMHTVAGTTNLNSSVAYVPQQAWIQNATLRDNILFTKSHQPEFYDKVLTSCALLPDVRVMPAGDETEIGEKGINLSGGQKQRVSLARAVYSQADIFLLDDPLSAVDSHVGKHIFDQVIGANGLMRNKTRLLVTHGTQWLSQVDAVAVVENGQLMGVATLQEWMDRQGSFSRFLAQYLPQAAQVSSEGGNEEDEEVKTGSEELNKTLEIKLSVVEGGNDSKKGQSKTKGSLVKTEETEKGKLGWSVYRTITKAYGVWSFLVTLVLFICYELARNLANIQLTNWTDDPRLANFTQLPADSEDRAHINMDHLLAYTGWGIAQTLAIVGYSILFQYKSVKAVGKFHKALLDSVLHAPMEFFDTTPMGRILNRFGGDVNTVDTDVFFFTRVFSDHCL